ncbi:MAG: hypothetical protein N2202_06605 [Proteobacteria bacterium]|nr:hypothetical protein [Pseudomonadota bacterium]
MKRSKFLVTLFAVLMMCGLSFAQTTVNFTGFIRVYPEINNYGYGSIQLSDDSQTRAFVDQRARIFFNFKTGENLGGTYATEIDFRWGDVAFAVARNRGGALSADTINIETKNLFLWFKPTVNSRYTLGVQGFTDEYMGIIFGGADMAGIRGDWNLSKDTSLMAGWFLFSDRDVKVNDGVYFIPVTLKQKMGNNTLSLSLYGLFDDSGRAAENLDNTSTTLSLSSNRTSVSSEAHPFFAAIPAVSPVHKTRMGFDYQRARIYYAGVNFSGKSGNVAYTLYGVYNWGEINGANLPHLNPLTGATIATPLPRIKKMDIQSYALHAMADVALGAGTLRGRVLYVSGGDKNKEDYNGMITGNQYSIGSDLPLLCTDLFILIRTSEDITHSTALLPDVNNNGRGVFLIYADYNHKLTDKMSLQIGAGYMQANDNRVDGNAALALTNTSRYNAGMHMGTEINAQLKYMVDKNMSITGVLAWADLGDYYNMMNYIVRHPDSLYRALVKFNYAF